MRGRLIYPLFFLAGLIEVNSLASTMPPVVLPYDEAPHNYDVEWWYYTGHLESVEAQPKKFAFEMTVFRGQVFDNVSGYIAHFALIDLDNKKHYPFERINPFASKLPPAPSTKGFKFMFDAGQWLVAGKEGHDRLMAKTPKYSIDLDLSAIKSPSLFGEQGIVNYGEAGEMAYYSRTRMKTVGLVGIPDEGGLKKTYKVTGVTWMDHQWGNAGNPTKMGWDWFSVQLNNETDLMMFQVRNLDTHAIVKTAGFVILPSGAVDTIPDELINIETVGFSDVEKVLYPTEWALKVPAPFSIDLTTQARFPEQRFKVPFQVTPVYWEGSCITEGTYQGEPVVGQGFTEMAGYE
jgi:predicted secreted hydrolase